MPVAQVTTAPSRQEYDAVAALIDIDANPPAGLIVHTASVTPSGEVQIVDVWESAELLGAFAQDRLFPAFAQSGLMDAVMAGPKPEAHETFHVVQGR